MEYSNIIARQTVLCEWILHLFYCFNGLLISLAPNDRLYLCCCSLIILEKDF